MIKTLLVPIILFLSVCIADAKEYNSSFGFNVDVPEHWLVLTPDEIKTNPDLFDLENRDFGKIDKDILKQMKTKILNGRVEMYFNQDTSGIEFTDNVNVMKSVGRLPSKGIAVQSQCSNLGAQLSNYFGRQINLYQCKLTVVDNLPALYSEFDGAVEGTRSLQYQVQRSPSVLLIITATCKLKTLDIIRNEFTDIIRSINFK